MEDVLTLAAGPTALKHVREQLPLVSLVYN